MLGGGHVRRRSVIDASPCPLMGKRKHAVFEEAEIPLPPFQPLEKSFHGSPNKARIIEKPSVASTSSFKFGGERMIKAKRGILERQSLEDSCLIGEGEELTSCKF
jgi:serine/arginine repetitive matrix protein 2